MRYLLSLLVLSACAFGDQTFEEVAPDAIPTPLVFQDHVEPILDFYCTSCHGDGLNIEIDLTQASELLDECDEIESEVRSGSMPPGGARRLSSLDAAILDSWFAQGCSQ